MSRGVLTPSLCFAVAVALIALALPSQALAEESSSQPAASTPAAAESEPPPVTTQSGNLWSFLSQEREAAEVFSSATKTQLKLTETPAIVSVITAAMMQDRGYRSVGEALRALAGITLNEDLIVPDVSMRGINSGLRGGSSILKVMINGHPTQYRSDNTNFLGPEQIPITAVDRIEIIRGPASALYGANAFLGVVNILTKKAAKSFEAAYRLSGQLQNDRRPGGGGALHLGGVMGPVSLSVDLAGAYLDRSGLQVRQTYPNQTVGLDRDSLNRHDTSMPGSLYGQLELDAGKVGTLQFDGGLQHFTTIAAYSDWALAIETNRLALLNGFGRLRWNKAFTPTWSASSFFSVHGGSPLPYERLRTRDPTIFFRRDLANVEFAGGVEVVYRFRKRDQLSLGVDIGSIDQQRLRYLQVLVIEREGRPAGSFTSTHERLRFRLTNMGAQAQLLVFPLSWLSGVAALRFDYNTGYGWGLSPRAVAVITPTQWLRLKLLYGRSFKAPSGVQLRATPALSEFDIIGNGALKPQTADTWEVATEFEPTGWLKLSANAFYMRVDDQIIWVKEAFNYAAINTDTAYSAGGEAEARILSSRVDAFVNGSFAWARTSTNLQTALGRDSRFEGTPLWSVNAGAQVRVPEIHLQGYVESRFVGERQATNYNIVRNSNQAYTLPPYFIIDVSVSTLGLKLGPLDTQILFRVQNLLDWRYDTPGFAGFDIPNLGRSFELVWTQRL